MLLTQLLPFLVVLCFLVSLLLSLPAGVSGSGAVESGSVTAGHLLPPCSCSTPSATTTIVASLIVIIVIIIINITIVTINTIINICTIFHLVYSNITFTVCTSVCILCRLPPSPLSLSLHLSLSLTPTGRGRSPPTLSHGSARGFCLLKGSFSLPLSPSACSWWELL